MIRLYVHGRLDKRKIKKLRVVLKKLEQILDIGHTIPIHIVPAKGLYIESDDLYCWACYRKSKPRIYLTGWWPFTTIVEDLCHEFAHYEQYRDGKQFQERGVSRRTRTIMRKLYEMLPRYGWRTSELRERCLQGPSKTRPVHRSRKSRNV